MWTDMDFQRRRSVLDALNSISTNGNGHHPMPDHDAKIEEHESRLAARFRIHVWLAIVAVLTVGGGLFAVAWAVDSGLTGIRGVLKVR